MNPVVSISTRFRAAREHAELSIAEFATLAGVSEQCLWDLESYDDELATAYSPAMLQRFATVLGVRPADLLGTAEHGNSFSTSDLASAIRDCCRVRGITVEQFGEVAGWDLTAAADSPQLFLTDISIEGVQDVCRELGIEWERFINGL